MMCPSSPNPVDPGIRGTLRAPSIQNGGLINKNIGILEGFYWDFIGILEGFYRDLIGIYWVMSSNFIWIDRFMCYKVFQIEPFHHCRGRGAQTETKVCPKDSCIKDAGKSHYIYNVVPPVISWFINPINCSYKYNKP
jgi:hypothetical protein